HRLWHEQVSLIHAPGLPAIPSPTTCARCVSSGHVTPRRIAPRSLPHRVYPHGNSGLRHSLAGSPRHTGRIEFLIVRTGRSTPAAPHPVSPRRSCRRLQVTLTWRGLSPLQPGALSGALARASRPLCVWASLRCHENSSLLGRGGVGGGGYQSQRVGQPPPDPLPPRREGNWPEHF